MTPPPAKIEVGFVDLAVSALISKSCHARPQNCGDEHVDRKPHNAIGIDIAFSGSSCCEPPPNSK